MASLPKLLLLFLPHILVLLAASGFPIIVLMVLSAAVLFEIALLVSYSFRVDVFLLN